MKPTLHIKEYVADRDFEALMQVIESEGEEWDCYSAGANREKYRKALESCITFVAYEGDVLCGYSRSVDDFGLDLYVMDLLVHASHRGKSIGKALLEPLLESHPGRQAFVLSDADGYYSKLGYPREGSIFEVIKTNSRV